jgi:hypothetical protein
MRFTSAVALLAVAACSRPAATGIDPDRDIGIARIDSTRACIALPRADLRHGMPVSLVLVPITGDSTPAVAIAADVVEPVGREDQGCPTELGAAEDHVYRVRVGSAAPQSFSPLFALAGPVSGVTLRGPTAWVMVGRDSAAAELRVCTSPEGLHLTIWRGAALHAPRLFHRYYHLNYDIEANCTEAEWVNP